VEIWEKVKFNDIYMFVVPVLISHTVSFP